MAKGSNPMQAFHKQKRNKEIQKSKQQRIKARDEKVVQTKTVAEVQEEIRNIKRRKNLQPSEQQKLQRLEKELKLVKAAATNQPKTQQPWEQQTKVLTELDDTRKSVYYDEKLNPYGAPPPGKPRLYHQRGGGVTMDVKLAVVPGEDAPPPPPPRPAQRPPPAGVKSPHQSQSEQPRQRSEASSNTKPRQGENQPDDSAPPKSIEKESSEESVEEAKKEKYGKPLVSPNLPSPSSAVQRSRRGKAAADIWASNEEVEYELKVNQIDLEAHDFGAVAPKKSRQKKKKPPLEIYYQDRSGQVQGPFPKAQMQGWFAGGFFPPGTVVKTNRNGTWVRINELKALQPDPPKSQQEDSVQSRIASLKQDSDVQDGIAALKRESTAEDRIAELKQQNQPVTEPEEATTSTVDERIAALRVEKAKLREDEDQKNGVDFYCRSPQPAGPSDGDQGSPSAYPLNDDHHTETIADIAPCSAEEAEVSQQSPYPTDEIYNDAPGVAPYPSAEDKPPAYPVDNDHSDVLPPPYPTDENYNDAPGVAPCASAEDERPAYPMYIDDNEDTPTPYPIDESYKDAPAVALYPYAAEEAPAYPVDSDDEGRYPVDSADQDVPYPVDDAYPDDPVENPFPLGGDEADVAYPVTDSYPVTEEYPVMDVQHAGATSAHADAAVYPIPQPPAKQPKKSIKVDKEVVAFMPSHLQNRKRKGPATKVAAKTKKTKTAPATTSSPKNDYDKFMEEIEGLDV